MVKQASARANREIGALDAEKADLIDRAAQLVIDGKYHDQFVVGVVQGGAGTSTNMNANEVITNIALELAGREKGDYAFLSPIDHTNRSQSTNDVYPTAIKVGLGLDLLTLLEELDLLRRAFLAKSTEFHDILKVGRTQLQDAVPMTLGQEFHGFATTLGEDYHRLKENAYLLLRDQHGRDGDRHRDHDAPRLRGGRLPAPARDLRPRPRDGDRPRGVHERHRRVHVVLGLAQAQRHQALEDLQRPAAAVLGTAGRVRRDQPPARQAGSSIMPGKVNPVIPEVVNQVAFAVAGADLTVTMAVEGGQLQLNAFEPIIAHSIFQSITWMRRAMRTLRVNCIDGITANRERLGAMVGSSVGVVTALTPFIGYAASAALAKAALLTGQNVGDLVVEAGLMSREEVAKQLSPARLSGLEVITAAIPIMQAAENLVADPPRSVAADRDPDRRGRGRRRLLTE